MNEMRFSTQSLRDHPRGEFVMQMIESALAAIEPAAAVRRFLRCDGTLLLIGDQHYDLQTIDRVIGVAFGKAGIPMITAAASILGDRFSQGIAVVKDGHVGDMAALQRVVVLEAGHPLPDARGVAAAKQVAALLAGVGERDLVLVLISGGGSALLTHPVVGVTLGDLQGMTKALLGCGATINEINALRKHLDIIKGGGLAQLAQPAAIAALILSDVIGDPFDVIASGPTVADPTTFADAYAVLTQYAIVEQMPPAILAYLQRGMAGEIAETPKPGDRLFARVQNVLIGSNRQAAQAALAVAHTAGFATLLLTTSLQGEAREASKLLASIAQEVAISGNPLPRPCCIVAGGETTVTLRGDGRGGRNQELALATVGPLAGVEGVLLVALATDGGDGPTDAAGAVVTGATYGRGLEYGLHPATFLARNDAYTFFEALGDLLRPGPTQTNVNDLTFLILF
jgi:hydroxypyruvate reductase